MREITYWQVRPDGETLTIPNISLHSKYLFKETLCAR